MSHDQTAPKGIIWSWPTSFALDASRLIFIMVANNVRAYPGSEFVVANTLAKWKKLESNEIEFSQKVVSRSCSAFNSLPASGNF